ncbi:MAG: tetratricopeptide repeat protein, partial [Acidobacteriia bacterium]|nr:tetratricopeptide repeat protein [Terriglobia bacterium]
MRMRLDFTLTGIVGVACLLLSVAPVYAQRPGGSAGGAGAGAGAGSAGGTGIGSPTRGNGGFGNIPGTGSTGTAGIPTRTYFLSGKVALDDGTPPSVNIRIERVCAGNVRLEGHTDSKGRFSLQLGQDMSVDAEAADTNPGRPGTAWNTSSSAGGGLSGNTRADPFWDCELRAAYPGYRSDLVELSGRRALDDPELGTIILHRLANVQGSTISVTTALAPKHAQKEYEKGLQALQKGDFANAQKHLTEATGTYSKYAIAWFALGQAEQRQNKPEDARKAWLAAIAADSKYVSPYDALAALAVMEGKWQDAVDYSQRAISLNPVEFPSAFWYNALANYNLKKPAAAEKSARELLKADTT